MRPCGRRAEPEFVFQAGRYRDDLGGAARGGGGSPDVDVLELADAAVADKGAGEPKDARGALLGAELKNAFLAMDFLSQGPVFGEVEAHGLFEIDILAGADGGQGGEHVPVIGRGDENGVNVLTSEQLAEVGVGGAVFVLVVLIDAVAGLFEVLFHDVADGDDPGVFLVQEIAHVPLPLRADADAADDNAAAGRDVAGPAKRGGGRKRGQCGGRKCEGGGLFQELAAFHRKSKV